MELVKQNFKHHKSKHQKKNSLFKRGNNLLDIKKQKEKRFQTSNLCLVIFLWHYPELRVRNDILKGIELLQSMVSI